MYNNIFETSWLGYGMGGFWAELFQGKKKNHILIMGKILSGQSSLIFKWIIVNAGNEDKHKISKAWNYSPLSAENSPHRLTMGKMSRAYHFHCYRVKYLPFTFEIFRTRSGRKMCPYSKLDNNACLIYRYPSHQVPFSSNNRIPNCLLPE